MTKAQERPFVPGPVPHAGLAWRVAALQVSGALGGQL